TSWEGALPFRFWCMKGWSFFSLVPSIRSRAIDEDGFAMPGWPGPQIRKRLWVPRPRVVRAGLLTLLFSRFVILTHRRDQSLPIPLRRVARTMNTETNLGAPSRRV